MAPQTDVVASIEALAARLGLDRFVAVCADLLDGAPRERYGLERRLDLA